MELIFVIVQYAAISAVLNACDIPLSEDAEWLRSTVLSGLKRRLCYPDEDGPRRADRELTFL